MVYVCLLCDIYIQSGNHRWEILTFAFSYIGLFFFRRHDFVFICGGVRLLCVSYHILFLPSSADGNVCENEVQILWSKWSVFQWGAMPKWEMASCRSWWLLAVEVQALGRCLGMPALLVVPVSSGGRLPPTSYGLPLSEQKAEPANTVTYFIYFSLWNFSFLVHIGQGPSSWLDPEMGWPWSRTSLYSWLWIPSSRSFQLSCSLLIRSFLRVGGLKRLRNNHYLLRTKPQQSNALASFCLVVSWTQTGSLAWLLQSPHASLYLGIAAQIWKRFFKGW